MTYYIYSTLTSDNKYTAYDKNGQGDLVIPRHSVLINGGANLADKNLITPKGTLTIVSDEDLEFLEDNTIFKLHKDNGFIRVEKKHAEVAKVVKDMEKGDKSKPKTPADYENVKGVKVHSVGKINNE